MNPTELLAHLGFEAAGTCPTDRVSRLWLKQGNPPHILISLPPGPYTSEDVLNAIYDAGRRDEQKAIADKWQGLLQHLKVRA